MRWLLPLALVFGCGSHHDAVVTDGGGPMCGAPAQNYATQTIPADTQRSGDPAKGYDYLVNQGYVRCGIPWSVYKQFVMPGAPPAASLIPGRTGDNAMLPYSQTAFTAASGVEVVSANCLSCHAGMLLGKVVVGLGNTDQDFTTDPSTEAQGADNLMLGNTPAEKAELHKWATRVEAIGPYVTMATVGVNPGDNLAAILLSHRDPTTLAWSDTPLIDVPPKIGVPVDVPPWWRMAKKNSMFYVDAGRGDHARIEMAAANLCTDDVTEAQMIDSWFPDIEAYLASIMPPAWPFAVDATLAAKGQQVFAQACATCHGSYGGSGSYPNLFVPLDVVGTDGLLALGSSQFASRYLDWWAKSFYGTVSRLEPRQGYVAPPLDGIWATAPYLHNGSVPTLAALLDSSTRPQFWSRSFDSNDYDQAAVGWHFTAQTAGGDKTIYDTTVLGYGNGGHTFGDPLCPDDRTALLEYLKTL
jgi:mono/diheme cytochrome c family protein